VQLASVTKSLWDRPAENPETAFVQSLYGPGARPSQPGKNGRG